MYILIIIDFICIISLFIIVYMLRFYNEPLFYLTDDSFDNRLYYKYYVHNNIFKLYIHKQKRFIRELLYGIHLENEKLKNTKKVKFYLP
jgi:hypothetical protein